MADIIQLRRDTKANWATKNPVLALGETGLETDTRKVKYGDGTTTWNNLPYSGGADYGSYDVSEANNGATYATLQEALTALPVSERKGGMNIRFINTANNSYVQFRYMAVSLDDSVFLSASNWQGIDETPTEGSKNLVESGSIYSVLKRQNEAIERLNGNDVIVVEDHTEVENPDPQKIYREQGTDSYTDWMYADGYWKIISIYTFPGIDNYPIEDSENLVKSKGIHKAISDAKNDVIGNAGSSYDTLGKIEDRMKENEEERDEQIENLVDGATDDYDTLGKIEERVKEESSNRNMAIEELKGGASQYGDTLKKLEERIDDEMYERVEQIAESEENLIGGASDDSNTLKKLENKINSETSRAKSVEDAKANKATTLAGYGITDGYTKNEGEVFENYVNRTIATQQAKIDSINGNDVVVVDNHTSVSSPKANTIYREKGADSYTDWMYEDGEWKKIATYDFPGMDNVPTSGSQKLLSSDTILTHGNAIDVSILNANVNTNPATPSTYNSLSEALASIPSNCRKGGMSIKFIQSTPATYNVVKTEGVTELPTGTELESASSIGSGTYNASQLSDFSTLPTTSAVTYYVAVTETVDEQEVTTYTTWVITRASAESQEYVQYRLMKTAWSNVVGDWQGVDSEPTIGSDNLVKSGGVYKITTNTEAKLEGVTAYKNAIDFVGAKGYVIGSNGRVQNSNVYKYTEVSVNGIEKVTFLGLKYTSNPVPGYAFGHYENNEWVTDYSHKFPYDTSLSESELVEITEERPTVSTHFRTTVEVINSPLTEDVFYCYAEGGNTVLQEMNELNNEVRILFFGNSLTQDAVQYVPWMLKKIAPKLKFKIVVWYVGGASLADQLERLNSGTQPTSLNISTDEHPEWVNITGQWPAIVSDVNHVTIQEHTYEAHEFDAVSYEGVINKLRTYVSADVKFHHLLEKTITGDTEKAAWAKQYAIDAWDMMPVSSIVNPGTAFDLAYKDATLNAVITSDSTYDDTMHAEEGLPCYIEACVVTQWLFKTIDRQFSVQKNSMILNAAEYATIGVVGPNVGENGPIFGTAAEQIYAQNVAVIAFNMVNDLRRNIDAVPTEGSHAFVESGGVKAAIDEVHQKVVETDEVVNAVKDDIDILSNDLDVLGKSSEDGFYITDEEGNVAVQYTESGLDADAVAPHLKEVMKDKTVEDGFFVADDNLNVGLKLDGNGFDAVPSAAFKERLGQISSDDSGLLKNDSVLSARDIKNYASIQQLKEETESSLNSLLGVKAANGNSFTQSIVIPAVDHDRKNVVARIGLHYGSNILNTSMYDEVYFGGNVNTDFSDVRFLDGSKILRTRMIHSGNYEVMPDNPSNANYIMPVDKDGALYRTASNPRRVQKTTDGVTWTDVIDIVGEIEFVDTDYNIYTRSSGSDYSKILMYKKNGNTYDTAVEIIDMYDPILADGVRTAGYVQDSQGYIYIGKYSEEFDPRVYRSINPYMVPDGSGNYLTVVYDNTDPTYTEGDQHVHHIHGFVNKDSQNNDVDCIVVGFDHVATDRGPLLVQSIDHGATWHEITVEGFDWSRMRGHDYTLTWLSNDKSTTIVTGEVGILGGVSLSKGYTEVLSDGSIKITALKEITNNSGGGRWAASFDDSFAIADILANGSQSDTYTLVWSNDLWETFKPLYSCYRKRDANAAGVGARFWEKAHLNGEDVLVGTGHFTNNQLPLRVFKGGSHYYGEILVEVGAIQAFQTKTITVESGYLMQSPNVQVFGETIKPIWSLPLNEAMGNTVTDSDGNSYKISGKYTWDSLKNSKRFGNFVPYQKSYDEGAGIMFNNYEEDGVAKYSGIELGKVIPLNRNKNFSVVVEFMVPDDEVYQMDAVSMNVFVIGDMVFRLGRNGIIKKVDSSGNICYAQPYYTKVKTGLYDTFCFAISDDTLPKLSVFRGDDSITGETGGNRQASTWDFANLSTCDCKVCFDNNRGMIISNLRVYDKCLTRDEFLSIYHGYSI